MPEDNAPKLGSSSDIPSSVELWAYYAIGAVVGGAVGVAIAFTNGYMEALLLFLLVFPPIFVVEGGACFLFARMYGWKSFTIPICCLAGALVPRDREFGFLDISGWLIGGVVGGMVNGLVPSSIYSLLKWIVAGAAIGALGWAAIYGGLLATMWLVGW